MRFASMFAPVYLVAVMPEGICVMVVKTSRKNIQLVRAVFVRHVDGLFSGGKVVNWQAFTQQLKSISDDYRLCGRPVSTCLSVTQTQLKALQVPALFSKQEAESEIMLQFMRGVSGQKYRLAVDFIDSGQLVDEYKKLYCVAAKEDYVRQYQHCFMNAGMKLDIVDIDVFALIRAVKFVGAEYLHGEQFCLLYVDGSSALLAGCGQEGLLFHEYWEADMQDFALWLDRCSHAFHKFKLHEFVVVGKDDAFHAAAEIVTKYWTCHLIHADATQKIICRDTQTANLLRNCPAAFAGLGLGLRRND